MPNQSVPGSWLITFDADNDEEDRTFEIRHDSPRQTLLKVTENGKTTVYGPIASVGTVQQLSTVQGTEIAHFRAASGAVKAKIDADGTARFDGGLRLPIDAVITPVDGLLEIETVVNNPPRLVLCGSYIIPMGAEYP